MKKEMANISSQIDNLSRKGYFDVPYYYKDLLLGKIRNYVQPWWSTKYAASKILDNLYISDIASVFNKEKLQEEGITHIITIVLGVDPIFPYDFTYKNIPARDITEENIFQYFDECYDFIEEATKKGGKVLVHCAYGISRSASIVIAYLIKKQKMDYDAAFQFVHEKRPVMSPNTGFRHQLYIYSLLNR